ncbi:GNAT family N-acetyltransferase [Streptomyces sp. NBC_01023]|uniref:GNAT family N-acetyltransferase n=1 Tax=Streptomyces sp. NBC_01023 TaxID=2903724 RepID=UPI003864B582|nr:GNAT family N-acetyltransferase [Streptomyces sp. NBC_01023]
MSTELHRDHWGIPHLRADSAAALAHAQGRNAATDRAWQLETERHRAQGTSAAFLGPDAVAWDSFARQVRLADTARRCYARLDADTAGWVRSYTDGVNAGLAEGARNATEFATAGLEPGSWQPWTPLAVWLSTHILFAGFPAKLWREEAAAALGDRALGLFATDGPRTAGSNGWLVTGARTASGAPILAGDPHRFIEAPGVYQQIHLACPEFDVAGLAVPGVPGIAHFGHTSAVAWSITNAMADYQDLYRERLRRTGAGVEACGPDGWEPAPSHTETIEVAGGEPVAVEVTETARGPVIVGGPGAPSAISLRYPPRVTGELGFEALPLLLRARTVADVDRAFDRWAEPVNVVQAADTRGGLLHRVAGAVPVRDRENGLGVVPGWEARYAWRGTRAPLPREAVDGAAADGVAADGLTAEGTAADGLAADGIAVMANQRGLAAPLGVEFAPPHRARRIRELLAGAENWSAPGMAAVHMDTRLPAEQPLLDLLDGLDEPGPGATALQERLAGWDRRMDAASREAAAYAALRAAVVRRLAGHPALAALAGPGVAGTYPEVFRPWLALVTRVAFALDGLLTSELLPETERAALVRAAAEETAPPDVPWGELHRLAPWQALPGEPGGPSGPPPGGWPGLSGDHDCVLSTSSVPGLTHRAARASTARYVWDLARRDDSLWAVPLGASGVPGDPHRLDQLPLWVRGGLVPVITDWQQLRSSMTTVHEQRVDGFGTVRISPVDPRRDSALIHSWVSQERARFWGMGDASPADVQETYAYVDSLTTHHAYLLYRDGVPAALFQSYEPAADPVGDCYDVQPGDHGIHLLIGPADGRPEHGFTTTLLSVFLRFVLADPSRQRIVVEPDVRNQKVIDRLAGFGFELGPEIDKPEKRARLAFLRRGSAGLL